MQIKKILLYFHITFFFSWFSVTILSYTLNLPVSQLHKLDHTLDIYYTDL